MAARGKTRNPRLKPPQPGPRTHHRIAPEPLAAAIGARIRVLRKRAGLSFDAFVGLTGLGRGYVSELERGLVVPSAITLLKIANVLQVPASYLLEGVQKNAGPRERLVALISKLSDESVKELLKAAEVLDASGDED